VSAITHNNVTLFFNFCSSAISISILCDYWAVDATNFFFFSVRLCISSFTLLFAAVFLSSIVAAFRLHSRTSWYLLCAPRSIWSIDISIFTPIKPPDAPSHTPLQVTLLIGCPPTCKHSPRIHILNLHCRVTELKLITQLRTNQKILDSVQWWCSRIYPVNL